VRLTVVVSVAVLARMAHAEDPWEHDVPVANQETANKLFAEANQLFAQQAHAPALEKYKAAIALWDHPLIRFNMAVTEIRLDRILDAAEDLEKALSYGNKPFTPELYQEALDYQALVKKQVGTIAASCDQTDVHVLLDGKPWFACPGRQEMNVLVGEHLIVGEKKEFMTRSQRIVVKGGATSTQDLHLVSIDSAVIVKYRYPQWVPYAIAAGGVAVAGGGLTFYLLGRSQMDQFSSDFTTYCPAGCQKNLADKPFLRDEQDSAKLKGEIGVSMMAIGGAAAITGVVLTIMNKGQRVLPSVEAQPLPGGAAASVGWRF
jgi:hypothetical protein